LLAGASGDVWDVESRRRVAAFDPVPAVGLSPDGTLAVGADGTLWDAGTGQYLGRLAGRGQALAFAPDGRSLIWQAVNDEVLLLGIRPVAAHQRLGGGAAAPDLLPLEPANVVSATLLGWWGADPLLNLRLIQDAPQSQAAVLGRNPFEALTLSPDGRTVTALTAAGLDQINPASGAAVDRFAIFLNPETVTTAAYLGADLLLLKGRAGVERWDLAAQSLLQRYNLQGEGLVVSPDGRWFALRQAGNVLVVDAAAGAVKHTFRVQAGPQEYQFAPDGRTLAVATGVLVDLYDVETGQRAASLRGRAGRPFGLAFAPDGTRLYAASGDVWSLPDGAPVFEQRLDLAAARLAVSPDGRLLAGDDGSLWDTATGLRVATLPELRGPAAELLFTADGRQLLWRLADGRVYTWGVRPPAPPAARAFGARAVTVDNARLLAITDHLGRGRLLDAVWSADDGYLAVNTTANVVIYTADTLARQRAFLDAAVLAFDAQGRALVGGLNHPLQLVDVGTGAVVKDYQRTGILAAAFSPDGRQLALGGRLTPDGKFLDGVAVIDPDGLERTFSPGLGSYDRFTGFAFTPDGTTLVVSFPGVNVRGSIWLWDVANGSRVREPIRGNSLPAVISPDSKYLA
ncbi:MAG: WD40 repeat domain-containing protein, partial [Anaerolineales bacterium]|nr:WD40 repeat domain-containing protein [Anaerolineales bacterium]